jgi:CspA family cold shock protein
VDAESRHWPLAAHRFQRCLRDLEGPRLIALSDHSDRVIKKLVPERGFGFVTGQDGTDYFLHRSEMADNVRFDEREEGSEVQFEASTRPKRPRATGVALLQEAER